MNTVIESPGVVEKDNTFASVPLAPLWDLAFAQSHMPASSAYVGSTMAFTVSMFAGMVGHSPRAAIRWTETGTIPWMSADAAAVNLGYHPMSVWGYEWLNVKGDYEKIASGEMDKILDRAIARSIIKTQEQSVIDLGNALALEALID
jgi:hypothetical protein